MTLPELQSRLTTYAKDNGANGAATGAIKGHSAYITFSHRSGYDVIFAREKPRYAVASISAFFLEQANFLGGFSICIPEQK